MATRLRILWVSNAAGTAAQRLLAYEYTCARSWYASRYRIPVLSSQTGAKASGTQMLALSRVSPDIPGLPGTVARRCAPKSYIAAGALARGAAHPVSNTMARTRNFLIAIFRPEIGRASC